MATVFITARETKFSLVVTVSGGCLGDLVAEGEGYSLPRVNSKVPRGGRWQWMKSLTWREGLRSGRLAYCEHARHRAV